MAATKRKRKAKSAATGTGAGSSPKRKRRKSAKKKSAKRSASGYVTRAEYKRDLGGLRSRVGKVEKRVTAVENGLDTLRKRWS